MMPSGGTPDVTETHLFVWEKSFGGDRQGEHTEATTGISQSLDFEGRADYWNADTVRYVYGKQSRKGRVTFVRELSHLTNDSVWRYTFHGFPQLDKGYLLPESDIIQDEIRGEMIVGSSVVDGMQHHYRHVVAQF